MATFYKLWATGGIASWATLISRRQQHSESSFETTKATAQEPTSYENTKQFLGSLFLSSRCASCCGIVGYVGIKDVEPILVDGIRILQNRGYDSCGIATIDPDGTIVTTKFASRGSTSDSIDLLSAEAPKIHKGHHIGIAHTRWATHGAKTDINAHPHYDYKRRISLVHNGTIENYNVLKNDLQKKNIPFITETDTEVIANLIGWHLDEGKQLEEAVAQTVETLRGTWGLAVIHKDLPDQIVLARNGSPLLVGCSESEVFVASEAAALASHTNQFLALHDGEICILTPKGIQHLVGTRNLQNIQTDAFSTSPAPFEHWTLKEIHEQPQSLARALNYGGRISSVANRVKLGGLDGSVSLLMDIRNLLIVGCGTSLYAAMYGEKIMQYLRCFDTVHAIDASELEADALPPMCGMLLLSQSGETLDTIKACQLAEKHDIRLISIVNAVGSLLARMTNCGVYLNAGREVAVASTKCFTSQVLVLSLVATWFAQKKKMSPDRCATLLDASKLVQFTTIDCSSSKASSIRGNDNGMEVAQHLKAASTMFVMGKGLAYPVALEGALKIKEISYIHAEGFAAGALKHGPFALIDSDKRTPVILIVTSDGNVGLMRNAAEQVKARGAYVLGIVDDPTLLDVADDLIVVPSNGPLTSLLCAIPLQFLANINPDKPRGLAKTVTVS